MNNAEKARELINKHLYLHGGDGLRIIDGDVYNAVIDAVSEALTIPFIGSNEVALLDKFTANDVDKAFIAGCINVGGIDGLDKELKRLKKIGFKTPTEALLAIKNSKQ